MAPYDTLLQEHRQKLKKLNQNSRLISLIRLVFFALCWGSFYWGFVLEKNYGWWAILFFLTCFLATIKYHQKIKYLIQIEKNLISLNQAEIKYLEKGELNFADGAEFINSEHFNSYDLDLFGPNSLYQHLNRTYTYIGSQTFAENLLQNLPEEEILKNQQAIQELNQKLNWRQEFSAVAQYISDKKEDFDFLSKWGKTSVDKNSKWIDLASFGMPLLFLAVLVYGITQGISVMNYCVGIFILNLILSLSTLKRIKKEIEDSERIDEITKGYSLLLEKIENESFESQKLLELKDKIYLENEKASQRFRRLSRLFSDLNNIQNALGAILLNGTIYYHTHRLRAYNQWKSANQENLQNWLNAIGEIEFLLSLSNFSFNNPNFCFPKLNRNYQLEFEELGHPLISGKNRITNSISFVERPFTILTGSNMSGKSTFLRTLGINMVLAGIGSAICAKSARVHSMKVLVSMRQTDSLADNESYFFAEVKRLKNLIEQLKTEKSFVLLDEILRGTNSDDKQTGTIGVIHTLMKEKAIGVIATHDIEVCKTEEQFPDYLINRCFEVEIINEELVFDYKLREGICKNKSASFLMKKMGIID